MPSNQLSKTPLNNVESCNSVFEAKNDTQLKYQQILEEHRWITNLIWNKIHALIVVNGILFSASKSQFEHCRFTYKHILVFYFRS